MEIEARNKSLLSSIFQVGETFKQRGEVKKVCDLFEKDSQEARRGLDHSWRWDDGAGETTISGITVDPNFNSHSLVGPSG